MKQTEEYRKFVEKYGKDIAFEVETEIKKKGKAKEVKRRVYVEEERYEAPNTGGMRGKAYCYLDDFTKELVVDFLEMKGEEDNLGNAEIRLLNFKEYPM